jgi:hypothetical protein
MKDGMGGKTEQLAKSRIDWLRRKNPITGEKKRTYDEIAEILNSEEFTTRNGGKFTGDIVSQIHKAKSH